MLNLDDAVKGIQIAFYVVASIVAVLTYRSAKRGLLNTVNTEYQKRVMDRLQLLSEDLHGEFDEASPTYWAAADPVKEAVDHINASFIENKERILQSGEFSAGILVTSDWARLTRFVEKAKSDPFIPKPVRDKVVDLLDARVAALHEAYTEVLDQYMKDLAAGKYIDNLEDNHAWLHNRINAMCYERGCGIGQVQEEVHELRLFIQRYLESFNPLK